MKYYSILTLGCIGDIQTCLEIILDTHCSTGFISQTLQQAGKVAKRENQLLVSPQPVLGERRFFSIIFYF